MKIQILIDSKLLQNCPVKFREEFAQLIHYSVFFYNCSWGIQKRNEMVNWHPQVNSPIPYPNIKIASEFDHSEPTIVISDIESNIYSHGDLIRVDPTALDFNQLKENLETVLNNKYPFSKKKLTPQTRFYKLYFPGAWEELFYHHSTLPPHENIECMKYGPFDFLRQLEYTWSLAQLNYQPNTPTIDIGSLKTFVPKYLAEKDLDVVSIDIDPVAVAFQSKMASQLEKPYRVELQDITSTSFESESFSQALMISVIEHIPGNGDILAVQEIYRLLKKDGLLIITVPYDHHWLHVDTNLRPGNYLQRYYNFQSIIERLARPPLFEVVDMEFIGGELVNQGEFQNIRFINPTNALIACIALKKR